MRFRLSSSHGWSLGASSEKQGFKPKDFQAFEVCWLNFAKKDFESGFGGFEKAKVGILGFFDHSKRWSSMLIHDGPTKAHGRGSVDP